MGRLARFIHFYTDEDDGNGGGSSILKTVSGALIHITDALAKPAKKFVATLEPIQSGSGDPSPENVRPITGHTGANVYRSGADTSNPTTIPFTFLKNLFDKTATNTNNGYVDNYYINGSGSLVNDNDCAVSEYISVKANTDYVVNPVCGTALAIEFYNSAKQGITRATYATSWGVYGSKAFTTPNNTAYIRISIVKAKLDELQLELGSEPTSYEPFDASKIVYGGTLTNEGGEWKLMVTETAYTIPTNKIGLSGGLCYSGAVRTEFGITINFTIKKCNMLKPDRYANLRGSVPIICTENGGYIYFGWDNMTTVMGSTQAEIRQYFTTNPLVIDFDLLEPIEYTLTESQALTLLKGENNIWCDASDDLELTYYADGTVSTLEALNTLLGGRYTNLGTPDDVPDREALQIILGETT